MNLNRLGSAPSPCLNVTIISEGRASNPKRLKGPTASQVVPRWSRESALNVDPAIMRAFARSGTLGVQGPS